METRNVKLFKSKTVLQNKKIKKAENPNKRRKIQRRLEIRASADIIIKTVRVTVRYGNENDFKYRNPYVTTWLSARN